MSNTPEDDTPLDEQPLRRFGQEEAKTFTSARLLEARSGVTAGAEVLISWRQAVLTAPVLLGGQLRHHFTCRYVWAPGMETIFVASDLELYDWTPPLPRWEAEDAAEAS